MQSGLKPSIFALAVVFGGTTGMTAASLFGVDAGGGFVVGFALLFVVLAVANALSRNINDLTHALLVRNDGSVAEAKVRSGKGYRLTASHGN